MTATRIRRFYLTPRDMEMLASINFGRYMTAQGLEWLHWPTWRVRWRAAQAAGTPGLFLPSVTDIFCQLTVEPLTPANPRIECNF